MNLLLDTHVFLWWDQATALNADTRAVIADPANQIFVSAVSIWEIAIKRQVEKARLPRLRSHRHRCQRLSRAADPADRRGERRRFGVATQRPIRPHIGRAGEAPNFHTGDRRCGDQSVCKRCSDVGWLTSRAIGGGTRACQGEGRQPHLYRGSGDAAALNSSHHGWRCRPKQVQRKQGLRPLFR